MNYSNFLSKKTTPQTQPIFGRNDQKLNNAGGYVFDVPDQALLERFLTIGTENGTYYVSEQKLTVDNAKRMIEIIKKDGKNVVQTLLNFTENNRALKQDPSIFVLALACTYGDADTKKFAYNAIHKVCRTSTHLFTFCQNVQDLRGWSRGLRTGVSQFYLSKSPKDVAYQLVKYRQRNGWTHRDVLRLAHTNPRLSTGYLYLFHYAVNGSLKMSMDVPDIIHAFENAQDTDDVKELVDLIKRYNLTWEMVPTEKLNNKEVLAALLENMPMTALLRNLNRFAISGLTNGRREYHTNFIVERLNDLNLLKKSHVHPITLLNTMKIYNSGHGMKGKQTWTPNQEIVDALNSSFELSFQAVEPTNKSILIAADVSGSMSHSNVGGMALSPIEIAAALLLTTYKTEPNAEAVLFDTVVYPTKFGTRTSYDAVLQTVKNICGGGTDCSLPFKHALSTRTKYDAIMTLTDSETWAGSQHPIQAYATYKQTVNVNTKGIVVGMVANECTLFPAEDLDALNIAGMDSSIPELIRNFIKD